METFGVARTDAPEVSEWRVLPKFFAIRNFVKFSNTYAVGISWKMFGDNIHGNFSEIEIFANSNGGGDAGVA